MLFEETAAVDERAAEVELARSTPLGVLSAVVKAASGTVAIAGTYAPELAKELGATGPVFRPWPWPEAPPAAAILGRLTSYAAMPEILPDVDALIVADVKWSRFLLHSPAMLSSLVARVQRALVIAVPLLPRRATLDWYSGFSHPEYSESGGWIWCVSPKGICEAKLTCVGPDAKAMGRPRTVRGRLRATLTTVEGLSQRVALAVDGEHIDTFNCPGDFEVELTLNKQGAQLCLTSDTPPLGPIPGDGRLLSFGVVNCSMTLDSGETLLSHWNAYRFSPIGGAQEECSVRAQLHKAGWLGVVGVASSSSFQQGQHLLPVTVGGPDIQGAFTPEGAVYLGAAVPYDAIGWLVCTPALGTAHRLATDFENLTRDA